MLNFLEEAKRTVFILFILAKKLFYTFDYNRVLPDCSINSVVKSINSRLTNRFKFDIPILERVNKIDKLLKLGNVDIKTSWISTSNGSYNVYGII